jgi:ABC-2 type transport system ATP-binding protein
MAFIKVENVSKSTKTRKLLNDVSIEIQQGEIATLEGINGSGKTLLLKSILGLIKTSGTVQVNQQTVKVQDKYPVLAGILIENPSLIEGFSAFKNLELLAELQPGITEADIYNVLERFDLKEVANQKVKNFSLGMKQKLGIAQAILGKNPLIILDEPTNALDTESISKLADIVKEISQTGTTFIVASHDHDFVDRISTHKFVVKEGNVSEKA